MLSDAQTACLTTPAFKSCHVLYCILQWDARNLPGSWRLWSCATPDSLVGCCRLLPSPNEKCQRHICKASFGVSAIASKRFIVSGGCISCSSWRQTKELFCLRHLGIGHNPGGRIFLFSSIVPTGFVMVIWAGRNWNVSSIMFEALRYRYETGVVWISYRYGIDVI